MWREKEKKRTLKFNEVNSTWSRLQKMAERRRKKRVLKRKNKNSVNHPPIPSHVHQKIKIDSVQKSREPKTVVG